MKRTLKLSTGVTLLEIMLVLAIASMVIVMSIRYYQQASNSENVNVILEQIQNITAAADNISQGTGGYTGVSTTSVTNIAGVNNMTTPYGIPITLASTANTVTMTIGNVPAAVCSQIVSKLASNAKYVTTPTQSGCGASGSQSLTVTYNAAAGS